MVGRIRTRLRERMAVVGGADLHEWGVSRYQPFIAGSHAEVKRRRIGGWRADRAERILDLRATAQEEVAGVGDRLAVARGGGIVDEECRGILLLAPVPVG